MRASLELPFIPEDSARREIHIIKTHPSRKPPSSQDSADEKIPTEGQNQIMTMLQDVGKKAQAGLTDIVKHFDQVKKAYLL